MAHLLNNENSALFSRLSPQISLLLLPPPKLESGPDTTSKGNPGSPWDQFGWLSDNTQVQDIYLGNLNNDDFCLQYKELLSPVCFNGFCRGRFDGLIRNCEAAFAKVEEPQNDDLVLMHGGLEDSDKTHWIRMFLTDRAKEFGDRFKGETWLEFKDGLKRTLSALEAERLRARCQRFGS